MPWNLHTTPEQWMRMKSKQKCGICGTELEVLFKSDPRDADTWFWMQCDHCDEPVCGKCSDIDKDGNRECTDCYQDKVFRSMKEESYGKETEG